MCTKLFLTRKAREACPSTFLTQTSPHHRLASIDFEGLFVFWKFSEILLGKGFLYVPFLYRHA